MALVRLRLLRGRLRLLRVARVLHLGLWRSLRRLLLRVLRGLLRLVLVVVLLRRRRHLDAADERARSVLRGWVGLVVAWIRGARRRGLLVVLVRRRVLLWLQTLVFGAVVVYPALGVITSLGGHPSEWGPIILVLVRAGRVLLRMLLELRVLGRHARLLVFLLQERVEVVLVVLVRGCELRAGPAVLPVPLVPLRSA